MLDSPIQPLVLTEIEPTAKTAQQTHFAPQQPLMPDVKCFWTLEADDLTYNRDDIMPDSYMELVVIVGAPIFFQMENGELVELPPAFINPLQRRPLRLYAQGYCQIIGMRLYPWALSSLLNITSEPTRLPFIPLNGIWSDLARELTWTVQHYGYREAIACFQQFVQDNCYQVQPDFHSVRSAGQQLYEARGQLRMTEVASRLNFSSSQLERRFKQVTNVSLKMYARLVRFESIYYALLLDPLRSATDLVHDYGYTDQSHFIHDFKAFAGRTPREFSAEVLQPTEAGARCLFVKSTSREPAAEVLQRRTPYTE
jgi:AraC-like DNA-binding protein